MSQKYELIAEGDYLFILQTLVKHLLWGTLLSRFGGRLVSKTKFLELAF